MARPLRIQYPGAVYHVTCRGNEKREIFKDGKDKITFLDILERSLQTYSVKLYSYVLMDNHFHLLVETPIGNLSEFMRHFNITYASHYNRRHSRVGHLYQGRYKSILVDKESYLTVLSRYIHLNPVRVKEVEKLSLTQRIKYLKNYRWSSLQGYVDNKNRESFIDYTMVLEEYGNDTEVGRKNYWRAICSDMQNSLGIKEKIVGQSLLGSEQFIGWVKRSFLSKERKMREIPSVGKLHSYRASEEVIKVLSEETGKSADEILNTRGIVRQMAMELLYRIGGLKGPEIGKMMGVDYSTVSQGRKRFRERLKKDRAIVLLLGKVEKKLSI